MIPNTSDSISSEELVKELGYGHRPDDVTFDIIRVPPLLVLGAHGYAVDTVSVDARGGGSRLHFRAAHKLPLRHCLAAYWRGAFRYGEADWLMERTIERH